MHPIVVLLDRPDRTHALKAAVAALPSSLRVPAAVDLRVCPTNNR